MKIGLFTEFSYPGKTEIQAYRDVMEQAVLADELGYYFFSTTESFGKDEISCSPFPLGHYVAMGQRTKRIRFLSGIITMAIHHPAMLASEIAAADLLTEGRIMVGLGRGHPWVLHRLGIEIEESRLRFEEGIQALIRIFECGAIEQFNGQFWRFSNFEVSPTPVQKPYPPLYIAAATSPESARFAGMVGQGILQPGYLGIPLGLIQELATDYRKSLPQGSREEIVLGIHLHVARDHDEAVRNGALALATQARTFLKGGQRDQTAGSESPGYESKSATRKAFEKLSDPENALRAVEEEAPNILAVWGTPEECIQRIGFYQDLIRPQHLMINIASGSLSQEKVLSSMRLFAEEVMPFLGGS